jgi:hypothetical protein
MIEMYPVHYVSEKYSIMIIYLVVSSCKKSSTYIVNSSSIFFCLYIKYVIHSSSMIPFVTKKNSLKLLSMIFKFKLNNHLI